MTAAAPAEQPAEVLDKLAALSADEPLPETYPADLVRLLVQSPYRIYLYWNHARDPFETLRRAFGANGAAQFRVVVRLTDEDGGGERDFEASPLARNFWFNVRPGRRYRASVGLGGAGRPFVRLLTSAVVTTPRVTVSRSVAPEPEFAVRPAEFARVLNEAGYASDALEVTLEAVDEATRDAATRRLAREAVGRDAPAEVFAETPGGGHEGADELRALLAALAFGVPAASLLPLLSPELAAWLAEVVREREHALNAERLLGLLRDELGLELDYDPRFDHAQADDARRPARFAWGGSDVQMPPALPGGLPHLRMPALSGEGLVSRLARWRETKERGLMSGVGGR